MLVLSGIKDFVAAALPFIIIGICLAIMFANRSRMTEGSEKNCMTEGMSIGMCVGVALSTALDINMGLGISLGMLVGETVGMFVKK